MSTPTGVCVMAFDYLWSTVLTPWLLVQDAAILTASPTVNL